MTSKIVLITGATAGIGKAVAERYHQSGATVVLVGRRKERLDDVVSRLGDRAHAFELDLTDRSATESFWKALPDELRAIDILVNNAGITRDGLLMRMKEEDWDAVLNTNLKSVYNCSKAAIKYMMKARAGRIVSISSVVGLMGNAGQANYAAAKAGIIGFTMALAKEVASRGITVNSVAPGFVNTDMTKVLPEKVVENLKAAIPLAKLGEPEDIAKAVAFLVSDDAAYITGQTLHVDGGMVM